MFISVNMLSRSPADVVTSRQAFREILSELVFFCSSICLGFKHEFIEGLFVENRP